MFVRSKSRGDKTYLQIVENSRRDGKVVQRVVATLGRLDVLMESGALDSILQSLGRFRKNSPCLEKRKNKKSSRSPIAGSGLPWFSADFGVNWG